MPTSLNTFSASVLTKNDLKNMNSDIRSSFIHFLRINGAKRIFTSNAGWLYENLFIEQPKDYIQMAFDWSETKQGYDYWNNIDEKWQRALTRLQ